MTRSHARRPRRLPAMVAGRARQGLRWWVGHYLPALALASCLATVLGLPAAARAAFPGANGRIAFDGKRPNAAIYTLGANGVDGPLDPSGSGGLDPAYSPDGQAIAYECSNTQLC